ncbi:hypothetical protein YDYSG_40240 [Paenibacillus tyrfis]|uniref:DUF4097 family beta strand repeat-containing protein n=1 Tax=Paenibacillus tyrfis TaxID=1501230 RepID=UPI00248F808D|nr:DUF4097 family beta strand repeat-containing protein [Paenibacillus tyrfis]GLI07994.1 hypothetical protein YDYSG_40240 [Paenibacillus tyrfis]
MRKIVIFIGWLACIWLLCACTKLQNIQDLWTKQVNIQKSIKSDQIDTIVLDGKNAETVEITQGNSDEILIHLSGNASSKIADGVNVNTETSANTLTLGIHPLDGSENGVTLSDLNLTIQLPEKRWSSIHAKTTHGNLHVARIKTDELLLNTSSGSIKTEKLETGKLELTTKYGAALVSSIQGDSIALQTQTGNIEASDFKAKTFTFDTKDGSVKLVNGEAPISGNTRSGSIHVSYKEMLHSADLQSNDGSIVVNFDDRPKALAIDFASKVGKGTVDLPNLSYTENKQNLIKGEYGGAGIILKARTTTGDFSLK